MTTKPANGVVTQAFIRAWLPLILVIASLAMTWGVMTTRLTGIERDVATHEIKIEASVDALTEIKIELAKISRDVLWIREQIDKR